MKSIIQERHIFQFLIVKAFVLFAFLLLLQPFNFFITFAGRFQD